MLLKSISLIFYLTETKCNDDHSVHEMHLNYKWIGKNRFKIEAEELAFSTMEKLSQL